MPAAHAAGTAAGLMLTGQHSSVTSLPPRLTASRRSCSSKQHVTRWVINEWRPGIAYSWQTFKPAPLSTACHQLTAQFMKPVLQHAPWRMLAAMLHSSLACVWLRAERSPAALYINTGRSTCKRCCTALLLRVRCAVSCRRLRWTPCSSSWHSCEQMLMPPPAARPARTSSSKVRATCNTHVVVVVSASSRRSAAIT